MRAGLGSAVGLWLLAAAAAAAVESPAPLAEQAADEVEIVAPCCGARSGAPRSTPDLAAPREAPREGLAREPALWARHKRAAADARTHPAGRHLTLRPAAIPTRAPKLRQSIVGLGQGEVGPSSFPPDPNLAVGPDRLLQVVNVAVRLSDRDGADAQSQALSEHYGLEPFNGSASAPVRTDPKAHYDPLSDRFFMVLLEIDLAGGSFARVYLSVSRSGSPATLGDADWCKYVFSSRLGNTWGDYPGLGTSERWLAVSTNNFPFSGSFSLQSRLFVIDKRELVDNAAACPDTTVFKYNLRKNDASEFVPQPAQHYEPTGLSGEPLFAVSSTVFGGDSYTLFRIVSRGSGRAAKPRLKRATVAAIDDYTVPPQSTQKDSVGLLETGDPRVMQQAVFRHGKLWLAHATGCQIKGSADAFSCVRVARIDPTESGGEIDFEDTFGRRNEYFFWPGLAVTGGGDVVAAFQRSGDNRLLGIAYAGMRGGATRADGARFGDAASLAKGFDQPKFAAPGECSLRTASLVVLPSGEVVSRGRTGDYIGIVPDPVSDDVWLMGEHGVLKFGGFSCAWGTTVARVRY